MNAGNKKIISEAYSAVETAMSDLQMVADELQEKFDALGEKAQEGEKGQELEREVVAVQLCCDALQNALDEIQEWT